MHYTSNRWDASFLEVAPPHPFLRVLIDFDTHNVRVPTATSANFCYHSRIRVRNLITGVNTMKYVCQVCGYVYDPAEHDNIAFENLPEDWVCPDCGVGKDQFSPAE